MAVAKTSMHYGLNSSMKPGDIVERVRSLKNKISFTFGDIENVSKLDDETLFDSNHFALSILA